MSIKEDIFLADLPNQFYREGNIHVTKLARRKFASFEEAYLAVREKEKRVLSISEIKNLPFVPKTHHDYKLWKTRRNNIDRFLRYLLRKNTKLNILDIGCGNGFFTNLMSRQGHKVNGADVNLHELEQAAEAFGDTNIAWYYVDLMLEEIPDKKFDVITFCCSFQYFDQPIELLQRCRNILNPSGEIHIIDSPFYSSAEQKAAETRSREYYDSVGVHKMANYYHHHNLELFKYFNAIFYYKPKKFFKWLPGSHYSPFYWIGIHF